MNKINIIKKIIILIVLIGITVSGCTDNKKMYLPEAENDKIFTVIGK